MSIRLGINDAEAAIAFYDATLRELGFGETRVPVAPGVAMYILPGGLPLMLAPPRDGARATPGNGETFGLVAPDAEAVDRWHSAGLANGGICEGPPGLREAVQGRYGAYLRDPDGHKLCAFAPLQKD